MHDKIGSLDDLCKLKIEPPDADAMKKARVRLDAIAKPLDGLGQLEQILVRIAGIQKTADVQVQKRAILVMCADNGIVEEGVSQTSDEVTALVAANIASGRSSVNHMASVSGTDVFVTDIGIRADMDHKGIRKRKIRPGTRNFAVLHPVGNGLPVEVHGLFHLAVGQIAQPVGEGGKKFIPCHALTPQIPRRCPRRGP